MSCCMGKASTYDEGQTCGVTKVVNDGFCGSWTDPRGICKHLKLGNFPVHKVAAMVAMLSSRFMGMGMRMSGVPLTNPSCTRYQALLHRRMNDAARDSKGREDHTSAAFFPPGTPTAIATSKKRGKRDRGARECEYGRIGGKGAQMKLAQSRGGVGMMRGGHLQVL